MQTFQSFMLFSAASYTNSDGGNRTRSLPDTLCSLPATS